MGVVEWVKDHNDSGENPIGDWPKKDIKTVAQKDKKHFSWGGKYKFQGECFTIGASSPYWGCDKIQSSKTKDAEESWKAMDDGIDKSIYLKDGAYKVTATMTKEGRNINWKWTIDSN